MVRLDKSKRNCWTHNNGSMDIWGLTGKETILRNQQNLRQRFRNKESH